MAKKTSSATTVATTENNVNADVIFAATVKASKDKLVDIDKTEMGPTRPLGPTHLLKGECFIVRTNAVFENKDLSARATANSKRGPIHVYYLLVQMCDENGVPNGRTKQLYVNALQRTVYEYALDEDSGEAVTTKKWYASSGTAIEEFHKFPLINDGLKAIAGKPIKVTDSISVSVRNFDYDPASSDKDKRNPLSETRVMQLDFIK